MILPVRLRSDVTPSLRGQVVAGTGHRPARLLGYSPEGTAALDRFARAWLAALAPRMVLSGFALGWDLSLAEAADFAGIPFTAVLPFDGQEERWPEASRRRYRDLLDRASDVVVVDKGGFSVRAMHARNRRLVDECELLLALFDGRPRGGTHHCLEYATAVDRPTVNLWHSFEEFRHALSSQRPGRAPVSARS